MRGIATFYHVVSARSIPRCRIERGKRRQTCRLGGNLASTTESTAIVTDFRNYQPRKAVTKTGLPPTEPKVRGSNPLGSGLVIFWNVFERITWVRVVAGLLAFRELDLVARRLLIRDLLEQMRDRIQPRAFFVV